MESSTSGGTGNLTVSGAVTGFKSFGAVCAVGDTFDYLVEEVDASGLPTGPWESGFGTYSAANTIARTSVHFSSNAGSPVNFGAGVSKRVFITYPGKWGAIPQYTKEGLPAAAAANQNHFVLVTDAKSGLGALAWSDGARWEYVQLADIYPDGFSGLQAALSFVSGFGQRLVVPAGSYSVTSQLSVGDNSDVEFLAGASLVPASDIPVIKFQGNKIRCEGLTVDCSGIANYSSEAVQILGTATMTDQFTLQMRGWLIKGNSATTGKGLVLRSGGDAVTTRKISLARFDDINIRYFAQGLWLDTTGGTNGDYINGNVFDQLMISACQKHVLFTHVAGASEISGNKCNSMMLQTAGATTTEALRLQGKCLNNYFFVKVWDWQAGTAFFIEGNGAVGQAQFNRIVDDSFGHYNSDGVPAAILPPNNYYESTGRTQRPWLNRPVPPAGFTNRGPVGNQDDSLALAPLRYTVGEAVGGAASLGAGGLNNLFDLNPSSTRTVNLSASGDSYTVTVDFGADLPYIRLLGVQMAFGQTCPNTVIQYATNAAPATWVTVKNSTADYAEDISAQPAASAGSWTARYVRFVFTGVPTNGTQIQISRIYGYIDAVGGPFATRILEYAYEGGSGLQNNWSPNRWAEVGKTVLNASSALLIGGLTAKAAIHTFVVAGTAPVLLLHGWAGSTYPNRLELGGNHLLLLPGDVVTIIYDDNLGQWRIDDLRQSWRAWRYGSIGPATGTTVGTQSGILPLATSNGGTISHPAISSGSYRNRARRLRGATGATAGTGSGLRVALATLLREAGFVAHYVWQYSALPANAAASFVGLCNTTGAFANADPNSFLNTLGFGFGATFTNLNIIQNDGTGTAAAADLGANFAVNTTNTFEAHIYCPAGGTPWFVVWRRDDLTVQPNVQQATSDLPATTALLNSQVWINNRAGAADYQIEHILLEEWTP